jgi:small subunit ribosomal protein S11
LKLNRLLTPTSCCIHINSTRNNTILTATNNVGAVVATKTAGLVLKSKRGKRSVPQAALLSGQLLGSVLLERGFIKSHLRIKGFGGGRENAIQGIISSGLDVVQIVDITSLPHNGCRPRKARRI